MGDENAHEKAKVSWIYNLNKERLQEQLNNRNIEFVESEKVDILRKRLVNAIRAENTTAASENKGLESKQENEEVSNDESYAPENEPSDENNMSGENCKIEFCLEKDDWDLFEERLELYFVVKDTKNEKKAAILLTRLDEEAYKLIKSLCAPAKPREKTYEQLTKLMSDHLKPKPSEVMERCKFTQARQQQNESVADFESRLKKLALNCNFTNLSMALRDQFVVGIRDEETRISLFKSENLTFELALREAVARETAVKNASNAMCSLERRNAQKEVFSFPQQNKGNNTSNPKRSINKQHNEKNNTSNPKSERNQNKGVIVCYCCGKRNHVRSKCRHKDKTCNFCNGKGHLESACLKKKNQQPKRSSVLKLEESNGVGEPTHRTPHEEDFYTIELDSEREHMYEDKSVWGDENRARAEPMYVDVLVNERKINMEIDSGTFATVISETEKNRHFRDEKIIKTDVKLRTYDNKTLRPLGKLMNLKVKFNDKMRTLYCFVLPGDGPMLMGRQWLAVFGSWPLIVRNGKNGSVNKIELDKIENYFFEKFEKVFSEEPGLYNKSTIKIYLKENARPIAMKCRTLAHAVRPHVDEEIDRLVGLRHLEKVETSEWATPIVPVYKSNGKVRICGDFSLTVNPFIIIDKYPLHTIDDIFTVMQSGIYFTELDLRHCYMQFGVDEESSKLLTIVTHRGLYRYKKIPEGVSTAPADVQKKMDECLRGIEGVISYIDNVYIMGRTPEECMKRTETVCERLAESGLKANKKCKFLKERIEVLGFVIDKDGLHKSKSKVDAMVNAPRPQNFKELNSFLGLINFYARFLKNRSENLRPLYDCANAKEFKWNETCEKAFAWVKNELISPRVLANFDPNEQVVLACDASSYGLSAILSHKYKDGTEKPIAFASKKIAKKELNRTILDKEAMAIIFGFKRFYQFIFGREIILRTDNQPLQLILGPRKGIPATANNRLQRWAYYLSGFKYKVEYIKSKDNANCDALSRLPVEDNTELIENDFSPINFFKDGLHTFDSKMLEKNSKSDETILNVMKYTVNGWPDVKQITETEKRYYSRRLELTVDSQCLFWGLRAVIPEIMRPLMLKELHASHMGIVKIKMLARSYVWWPGIDKDIENYVNACATCLTEQKKPPHTPLTTWPWPDRAWHRIHCDFLGPFYGDMHLVIIDAHTKWPEIINFKKNTKAYRLVQELKGLFARYGLPVHVVTDGGPQFRSDEFLKFLKENGVAHSFSPPHHPATNGAAENFVGTFKNKVSKIVKGGETPESAINLFLFDYRNIEHCTTGKSPSQLMYKRDMRTRFDLLRTSVTAKVEQKQRAQIVARAGKRKNDVNVGDDVLYDNHAVRGEKRLAGEIVKKVSPSTYMVKDSNNNLQKRHIDQLLKRPPVRRSPRLNKDLKKAEDCDVCESAASAYG